MSTQPACPECDKLLKVSEESNKIGAFLDYFLGSRGLHLAHYAPADGYLFDDDGDKVYIDEMLVPASEYRGDSGISRLLAEYYGIDLDKVEQERRALLDWIRDEQDRMDVIASQDGAE